MGGNRMVIVLVVVLLLAVGGFAAWWFLMGPNATPTTPEEGLEETATPMSYTEIVVAVQNIPLGMQISQEDFAIELQPWPEEFLPLDGEYYTSLEEVEGKFARMEIPRGFPLLRGMIGQAGGMLSVGGSAASLFSYTDRVAYALPMDTQGSIAWAIRPGDHVDVIAAVKTVAVTYEAAKEGVNQFTYLEEPDMPGQTSLFGRFELLPNGRWGAIYPASVESTMVVPHMLVQLTVQDAIVWHVGIWEDVETIAQAAEPTTEEGGAVGEILGGGGGASEEPVTTGFNMYQDIEPVTLLVTRDDALVLKYLYEMGADLDLVMRPAGYTDTVIQTQPIWLRYIMDRYQFPDADTISDMPVAPSELRDPLALPTEPPQTLE
ncbi:MAG: hypothetical protein JXA33_28900 [Anaerolineae bacterium]|nr:hypothetical protein [Anaerolineae bacterium]